jgi:hypothetical protein
MTFTTQLTINDTDFPIIKVGDHYFTNISVSDFCTLDPAPLQRNSQDRVSKMKPIFDNAYIQGQHITLTEVVIGVIVEDFDDIDPDTGVIIASYKAGWIIIIDGNTRKFYWLRFPKEHSLTAKIHYLRNMDDVKFAYYPYNSQASVEKTNHLLQGLARRYQWQPRQPMFANGSYKTALDWATYRPGDAGYAALETSFNFNFDELKVLDTLPKNGGPSITKPVIKRLKSQAIISACLIALKLYPNNIRLFEFIDRISALTFDDIKDSTKRGDIDAVEVVAAEYTGWSKTRGNQGPDKTPSWTNDFYGSTNFASREPQLDFLLHFIIEYIQSPNKRWNFDRGIKPSTWHNTWKETVADTYDDSDAAHDRLLIKLMEQKKPVGNNAKVDDILAMIRDRQQEEV